jgi:hypothetical protein
MLGQEPPQPKLWKAFLGAAIVTFPTLYLLDVALMHHRPGWWYVIAACTITTLLGYQMHAHGPQSVEPIGYRAGGSYTPPPRHERHDSD